MNQVKLLGLALTFVTVSPSNIQVLPQTQRYGYSSREKITAVREVLLLIVTGSCSLVGPYDFWGISPRNSTLFTRPFLAERCVRAWHETKFIVV